MKIVHEKTIVFIDAGYESKISKHFGKGEYMRIDLIKFAQYLAMKQGLWCTHIFYYTAPPYQSPTPTKEETRRKAKYDIFMDKLSKKPEITMREGRLQKTDHDFIQKGVDTLLTMDLTEEPIERKVKTIVLLACDTDFVPVLNKIRNKHDIKVILYYFMDRKRNSIFSMSNYILTACDKCVNLTEEYFKRNLRDK